MQIFQYTLLYNMIPCTLVLLYVYTISIHWFITSVLRYHLHKPVIVHCDGFRVPNMDWRSCTHKSFACLFQFLQNWMLVRANWFYFGWALNGVQSRQDQQTYSLKNKYSCPFHSINLSVGEKSRQLWLGKKESRQSLSRNTVYKY